MPKFTVTIEADSLEQLSIQLADLALPVKNAKAADKKEEKSGAAPTSRRRGAAAKTEEKEAPKTTRRRGASTKKTTEEKFSPAMKDALKVAHQVSEDIEEGEELVKEVVLEEFQKDNLSDLTDKQLGELTAILQAELDAPDPAED